MLETNNKKNNSILLIEDNPDDEYLTLLALKSGNVSDQTLVLRDGQEALDYLFYEGQFKNRGVSNPEVILLDLKLPKVDGMEVLKRIRSNDKTKYIPVIILTSSNSQSDISSGFANGANRYLEKPIEMKNFAEVMAHFIVYRSQFNKRLD
jgi:two-component system, response regulator